MRHTLIAIWAVAVGCFSPTDPRFDAQLEVPHALTAEISSAGGVTWARFQIPATITNAGQTPLRFHGCGGFSVEEAALDARTVWSPLCILISGGAIEVQPGETRHWIVQVSAAISGPGGPTWNAGSVEGTYRLRLYFHEAGGRSETRVSNPFVLDVE